MKSWALQKKLRAKTKQPKVSGVPADSAAAALPAIQWDKVDCEVIDIEESDKADSDNEDE